MNPTPAIERVYTVDDQFEHLSARAPVQVWTQGFAPYPGAPRPSASDRRTVGRYDFWDKPDCEAHDHEHFELAFILEGHAEHHTDSGSCCLGKGDVLAIAPGEVHGFTGLRGTHLVNCAYLLDWLMYNLTDILADKVLTALFLPTAVHGAVHRLRVPQWHIGETVLQECLVELEHLAEECAESRPSLLYLKSCLFKLMTVLTRSYPDGWLDDVLTPLRPDIQEAIQDIEICVLTGASFCEAELAEKHRLAPDYFSRVFKQNMGRSPMAYYQQRRIHHACWRLLNTQRTITEIAHELGFCHSAHFSTAFLRARGMSPNAYRRRFGV